MAYPEPMTDRRHRIIENTNEATERLNYAIKAQINNPDKGYWPSIRKAQRDLREVAAREMAILIRERLEYYEFDETLELIDDLLASLVSAETPQVNMPIVDDAALQEHIANQPICMTCDGCGWCEGSPAFTCPACKGTGASLPSPPETP